MLLHGKRGCQAKFFIRVSLLSIRQQSREPFSRGKEHEFENFGLSIGNCLNFSKRAII
jgi:hypothetical protein